MFFSIIFVHIFLADDGWNTFRGHRNHPLRLFADSLIGSDEDWHPLTLKWFLAMDKSWHEARGCLFDLIVPSMCFKADYSDLFRIRPREMVVNIVNIDRLFKVNLTGDLGNAYEVDGDSWFLPPYLPGIVTPNHGIAKCIDPALNHDSILSNISCVKPWNGFLSMEQTLEWPSQSTRLERVYL